MNGLRLSPLQIVSRELPRPLSEMASSQTLVERLLQRGANPLQPGPDGQLPRHHAHDLAVRDVLLRAERWWRRRTLLLAREFAPDGSHIVSRLLLEHLKIV